MEMNVEGIGPGLALVVLSGRLDIAGAQVIDLPFSTASGANRSLIVDMAAVTFLASIGIRVLVLGAKSVARRGGKLVLLAPAPEVEEVLEVTGLTDMLPIVRTMDEARAAIS